MKTDPRIEEWKESYRLANNQEPPEVVSNGRGWWRIGDNIRTYYRAKDFVRFRENLQRVTPPYGDSRG